MPDLLQFQRNLKNINVWEILIPIIDKHLSDVEELNKEQLRAGKRADGRDMPPYSKSPMSEIYIDMKIDRGAYDQSIYPAINLYNTGSFQEGIMATISKSWGIFVDSKDSKANYLEERYGSTIYGLNNVSLEKFIDIIIEEFIKALYNLMLKD